MQMTELQNCLPEHTRPFFIRLRNLKWEESRQSYNARLSASRSEAAARNVLKSGFQIEAEWNLAVELLGDLAFGYFQAAIETCTLYGTRITKAMCDCIETAVRDFLLAQRQNAISNAAENVPGAAHIPLSSRQQLSGHPQSLPRYNEILIALERARVENERSAAQKTVSTDSQVAAAAAAAKERREYNRPDVLNVLIASPGDVNDERNAVTAAIHEWNAINSHPDTINILLHPIKWETHSYPESGDRPQALLNQQIVTRGDFLIGIFGVRLGTPTGVAESGTIEEIEQFRELGKYVALYFSNAPVQRNVDRDQLEALERYKEARKKDTKYEVFSNADDLRSQVSQHLTGIVMSVAKPLHLGMWRNESSSSVLSIHVQKALEMTVKNGVREAELGRRQTEDAQAEAARWRPLAGIVSEVEGQEQVNKLNLKSNLEFALVEASLLSSAGAKLHDYPVEGVNIFSRGFSVPITHASLLKVANNSQSYFQFSTFQGGIKFAVIRQRDGIQFIGVLPFEAETVTVSNTLWFKLTG
jgi:hypothetical protein